MCLSDFVVMIRTLSDFAGTIQELSHNGDEEEQPCPTNKEFLAAAKVWEIAFAKEGNYHSVHQIKTEVQKFVLKSMKQVMIRSYFVAEGNWIHNKNVILRGQVVSISE